MPDFAVGTAFNSKDRVTGAFKKMSVGATKFGRTSEKAFSRASRAGSRFRDVTKGILTAGALSRGLGLLQRGLGAVTRQYIEFDNEIFGATARFKAAEKAGTDMTEVMKNLRVAAREVGAETQFTAAQAAFGLNKFALAGFTSAEAIKALRSQIDLTTVTGEDFARVADISTDLLGAFGGAALESSKKVAMLKQMNALLAVGTLSANVTMEDLFEGLKKSAPIATKAGIAMKDIIAATSVLGSAGIKGTMAGTAMMNMFTRLASPTKEVAKGFELLGLRQKDFITDSGKIKNIGKIFATIGEKTKNMTPVETLAVFDKIFGKRAIAGSAVLSENIGQLREQLMRMGKDPQKAMQQTAEFMRQSIGNRLKTLESSAIEFGFKFLRAFDGDAKTGIQNLTGAIKKIDVKPFVTTLKLVVGIFKILVPLIPTIIKGFLLYKATLIAVAVTQNAIIAIGWIKYLWLMRAAIVKSTIALVLQSKALLISTVATWAAGAAMAFLTSPITLIILAVAALVVGIILLAKNWDWVKDKLILGAYTVADVFLTLYGTIAKGFISVASTIGKALGFDTSALESAIQKINALQKSVRSKGAFGQGIAGKEATGRNGDSAPNAKQVQAIQKGSFQADINFNNLPREATVKEKTKGAPFVNLMLLGANP